MGIADSAIPSCLGRIGVSPYTEDDEAATTAGTLQSFAATRTFSVPLMFASFESAGPSPTEERKVSPPDGKCRPLQEKHP